VGVVGLNIGVRVPKEKRREFLQGFEFLAKVCDQNDACISQSLFEDVNEMNRFLWIEQWSDIGLLKVHLRSSQFRSLLGAIEVLGELEGIRMVEFAPLTEIEEICRLHPRRD
jgi:quinol monooxygenase YgiN